MGMWVSVYRYYGISVSSLNEVFSFLKSQGKELTEKQTAMARLYDEDFADDEEAAALRAMADVSDDDADEDDDDWYLDHDRAALGEYRHECGVEVQAQHGTYEDSKPENYILGWNLGEAGEISQAKATWDALFPNPTHETPHVYMWGSYG